MSHKISIRPLHTIEDFNQCQIIQKKAWGLNDIDIIPIHFQKAFSEYSIQIGLFDDNKLIGIALCYPSSVHGDYIFHMIAILKEYRGFGYSKLLANNVFLELIKAKFKSVVFSFDLFDFRNSNFYINSPNVYVFKAEKNYYGEINSKTHHSLPSHRLFGKLSNNGDFNQKLSKNYEKLVIEHNSEELRTLDIEFSINFINNKLDKIIELIECGYVCTAFEIATKELIFRKLE